MGRKNRRSKKTYCKPFRPRDRKIKEIYRRSGESVPHGNSLLLIADQTYPMKAEATPRRMEIWFADLGYHGETSVQNGQRPVIVISNDVANRHAETFTVLPMTTKWKKLSQPTHVVLHPNECHSLQAPSMVLVEQITTIGRSQFLRLLGRLADQSKMSEIEEAVRTQLELRLSSAAFNSTRKSPGNSNQG